MTQRHLVRSLGLPLGAVTVYAFSACVASRPGADISVGLFLPALAGDVELEPTAGGGTVAVDLGDDLDLQETDSVPLVQGRVSFAGLNVLGSAWQTSRSGTGLLTADFGDIAVSTPVRSEFDLFAAQAAVTFNLVDVSWLRLAPGIGADWLDVTLEVEDLTSGLKETLEATAPVPLLYLDAAFEAPVVPVGLDLRVGAVAGSWDEFEGSLVDGQARLVWHAVERFDLFAGYRLLAFELDGTTDGRRFTSDFDLAGFLIGAALRF